MLFILKQPLVALTRAGEIQASPPHPVVKLKNLLEEALKNRPALHAAKHEAESKEAEIRPKGSYENPLLGFTAMNYPADTLSSGEFGMTGNEFSLTQKIPFPGKLSKLSRATQSEAQAKKATYNNKELQLIREVKIAYYDLFLAYKKRDLLTEQLNVIRQLITVTRSKYTLGKISQAELLSLQMEEGTLLDQMLMAQKQIRFKIGDLNHAVGRSNHHWIGIPEEIKKTEFNLSQLSEQAIREKIVAKNPGLKSMNDELEAAESQLSYAKWNYLPDLELRVAYTQRVPSPGDRGVDFVSAGVGISIPLWAWSKESEEVRGARAKRARAEAMLNEERLHLLHEVFSSYSELEEAHKRMQLLEGGLIPLAKQSVQAAKSAYLTGRMDYASLLNVIRGRFQTELSYFEALAQHESKVAEFESLLGEPLGSQAGAQS